MKKFTKIIELAQYTKEQIEEKRGFQREVKDGLELPILAANTDQYLTENKILL